MVMYEHDEELDKPIRELRFRLSPSGCNIRDLQEKKSYDLTVENVLMLLNKLNRGEL
jgi:hypothetical protein